MPHTIAFDTLAYAKKLKEAGFTEKQAEVQAQALAGVIDENLATKHDIELLRRDLKEMEGRIKADIIKWVAGMLVAQAAIVATLVKLL